MNLLHQQIKEILENGTEEEQQVLKIAVEGIQNKRGEGYDYISNFLKVEANFAEDGTYLVQIPIHPFILNRHGITHGGLTATLIDIAMGRMINLMVIPEGKYAVTSELKINYISPGVGSELKAIATLIHKGNHLCVLDCKVYNDQGNLVAVASGTFFLLAK